MNKGKQRQLFYLVCFYILFSFCFAADNEVEGFTPGKTYDASNWQEIENMGPFFLLDWVKKGEFVLKSGTLNFDLELEQDFLQTSRENAGRFDVNEKGLIVEKTTQKQPEFIYGLPFPHVGSGDAKAAEKIMANFKFGQRRLGGIVYFTRSIWIGEGGAEREMIFAYKDLYYQGRPDGPMTNPNNFLRQYITYVVEPMESRGTLRMDWRYNDERQDSCYTYVTALRRMKRASPNTRSDPGMGSDAALDDEILWAGKNSILDWKLIGEKEILCGFTSPDKITIKDGADGTVIKAFPEIQLGFQVSDWNGAAWAPVNATWAPRPVWIVEGVPKDPAYNYARQRFYVDKDTFIIWYKAIYDKTGEYYKGGFITQSYQVAPSGRTNLFRPDSYVCVDDKTHHATHNEYVHAHSGVNDASYMPASLLGPNDFSMTAAQKLSK